MADQPAGPELAAQGPFKAEVKWKEGVTDEQRTIVAEAIAMILKELGPVAPVYNAIESITLSPSGN